MEQIDIFEMGIEYHYRPPLYFDRPIRLFEAFAGVGCQAMAFKRAGIPFVSVGISEIDKYSLKSYEAIHGSLLNYGDICAMETIPPCDVFTWSFPCTDLSKAGKRKGMTKDTRSGLVYEVLRLIRQTSEYIPHRHVPKKSKILSMGEATDYYHEMDKSKLPKCLIMENVPDLVQEAFKAQFYEIQKEIEFYGYKNFTLTLNAKEHGVAQNRDRVFMVSLLGDYHYEFPMTIKLEKRLKDYLEEWVDEKYYLSDKMVKYFQDNSKANAEKGNGFRFTPKSTDDIANALTLKTSERMEGNFVVIPEDTIQGNLEQKIAEPIAGQFQPKDRDYNIKGKSREERFELRSDKISNAILTNDIKNCIAIPGDTIQGYALAQEMRIRKLTPRECWRLMGISKPTDIYENGYQLFDDSDFDKAQAVCSNSQLYKQAGNGIVVDVFAAILNNLIEYQPKGKE